MLQTLFTAFISYLGTSSDYFVVLLLVFGQYRSNEESRAVIFGAYLGNLLLIGTAIVIAVFLKRVPSEWVLGLLGIIPVVMGIYGYFSNKNESATISEHLDKIGIGKIIFHIVWLTIVACGADNLALYIPYFATTNFVYLPIILIMFAVVLTVTIFVARQVTHLKIVYDFFEKYGDMMQLIIYVVLGIYIMFAAGTFQHLISLL